MHAKSGLRVVLKWKIYRPDSVIAAVIQLKMNKENQTIAFTIGMFNSVDGPSHCVYTQAYGMEMQVDDEWPLNILVMAPPHLVASLTNEAEITSAGMIPGASYTPGDGNYQQISDNGGVWVVARSTDDFAKIAKHNLGVLLVLDIEMESDIEDEMETEDEMDPQLEIKVPDVSGMNSDNLIVAFPTFCFDLEEVADHANLIRSKLPEECRDAQILACGCFDESNLLEYAKLENVSGLLMLDASFDSVLELIGQIVG